MRGHQVGEAVGGRPGQCEETLQDRDGGVAQPRIVRAELLADQGHRLLVRPAPFGEEPRRHPHGVAPVGGRVAGQLPPEQSDPVGRPPAERGVQRPQELCAFLVGRAQASQLTDECVGIGPLGQVRDPGPPGSRPEEGDHGGHEVGGQAIRGAGGELAERGEAKPRVVRCGAECDQTVHCRGAGRRTQAREEAEGLGEGRADALLLFLVEPPRQQPEHPLGFVEEERHGRRRRPAHLRVPVPGQPGEDRGTRPYRGPGHGVVVVGGIRPFERSLPGGIRVLRRLFVEGRASADTDEQFHDAAPVGEFRPRDEREQEGDARECRVVHIALVVHGAVHSVERSLTLLGAGRGQSPQQVRYLLRASVGMLHRGPVDLVDPREHGVLPGRSATDRECAPRH
ncbi:hypothetical protein ACFQ51_05405 [Streptomyces kaempferi]